jgi:exportin-T
VTPNTIPLLFTLLADPSLPIRLATSVVLLRICPKTWRQAAATQGPFVNGSHRCPRGETVAQRNDRGVLIDEGEETYREALGKLLNALGLELVKLTDVSPICETTLR